MTRLIGRDGEDDIVLHLVRVAPSRIQDGVARLTERRGVRSASVERQDAVSDRFPRPAPDD